MWVQLHGLPLGMMNRVYSEKLENLIGEVEDIVVDKDELILKIKLWVDITRPQMRDTLHNHKGMQLRIPFKYKRLPNFCFQCGIIKHFLTNCTKVGTINKLHKFDHTQYVGHGLRPPRFLRRYVKTIPIVHIKKAFQGHPPLRKG